MGSPSFYTQLDKRNKYILKCCFFVFAVNGLYAMILGSLLPLISSEYGLNNTVSGALLSAHQVGNLIAGFIAGVLPIYLGRKKSILFLCSFVVMGFFIMIITGNPVLLILGFLFTGLSRGSISNFNNTVVNEVSNSSPGALNILHSVFAIGALTSPFLVIACTNMSGDRGWKIAAGVIIFLAIISMILFSQMEIDDLLWVVILAGRLTCAFIVDRISKKTLLLVTSIGTVAFYLLLLSTQNILVITIAIMGLGFSMAGIYPTTVSTFGSTIKLYPMSMGALLMLSSIGSILMPIIVGSLSDNWGIWAGMSAIVIAIVMMLVFVLINVFHVRES